MTNIFLRAARWLFALPLVVLTALSLARAEPVPLIGYSELRTNLPGGRRANVRTMRAMIVNADGAGRRGIGEKLAKNEDTSTQFAGWSPDGAIAILNVGWESRENAKWEEQHRQFRMDNDQYLLDTYFVDLASGNATNITAVERVSNYNSGVFFLPDGKKLAFTPLINGVSKPFVMDLDGRNKRDVSGKGNGFAYGFTASPDGKLISYHENYQIYVSNVDGAEKRHIDTGNPFNFLPQWSPDGQWLLLLSGEHHNCHPYLVHPDGSGLRKLADRGGYEGFTEFLDVYDFHEGSSDTPIWSVDGKAVFYTGQVGKNVELFRVTLDGKITQLTATPPGCTHYHPQPSPDGTSLLYGSKRNGARNLFVMKLSDRTEKQITELKPGFAAMWPHWQSAGKRGGE